MPHQVKSLGLATGVLVAAALGWKASRHSVSAREERIFRTFNDAHDALHLPAWVVMQSGSLAAVVVVSAELLKRGRKQTAAASLVAGIAVWSGVKIIKPIVGRGRPSACLADVTVRGSAQSGLGFPSGHAAVATTLALIATRGAGPMARSSAVMVAGVTGAARMYVGAHLPLDVVEGVTLGLLCGHLVNHVLNNQHQLS
ncbi:MAG: phosphatase PAP2 family protein [Acidimicrobiales bacterium]|nr:phosphatase PAP2 family protein [Acidimicrobiales bacterium]